MLTNKTTCYATPIFAASNTVNMISSASITLFEAARTLLEPESLISEYARAVSKQPSNSSKPAITCTHRCILMKSAAAPISC